MPGTAWMALLLLMATSTAAQEDDRSSVTRRISVKFHEAYEQAGAPIKGMLKQAGLSVEDSERVADAFIDGMLSCVLDAAQRKAEEESISYKEVLQTFERELEDPAIDEPSLVESASEDGSAEACAMREMQKAGISVKGAIEYARDSTSDSSQ